MTHTLKISQRRLLADTLTPVNIYLKLRDQFAGTILLESSDYHGHENSLSLICCDPIASFQVFNEAIDVRLPDGSSQKTAIKNRTDVIDALQQFRSSFKVDADFTAKYPLTGMFGYIAYDAVRYFEDIKIPKRENLIPDILYKVYRYVIVVDHFTNEMTLFESTTGQQG